MDPAIQGLLEQWRASNQPLLDVRSPTDFAASHLSGATGIAWEALPQRVSELPPKRSHVPVLAYSTEQLSTVVAFLEERDYIVPFRFVWNEELINSAKDMEILSSGQSNSRVLWEPSPCLLGVIELVERLRVEKGLPAMGSALDLACGGGRDAVFLSMRGWKTTAVDYQQKQCDKVMELASFNGVSNLIEARCIDLEKDTHNLLTVLQPADLVNVARYLNRDMMEHIRQLIKPGGFIVFHQFMVGCTKPHRPKFLLRENELATEHFSPDQGFRVLENKVIAISDGRPTSYFLAQKLD